MLWYWFWCLFWWWAALIIHLGGLPGNAAPHSSAAVLQVPPWSSSRSASSLFYGAFLSPAAEKCVDTAYSCVHPSGEGGCIWSPTKAEEDVQNVGLLLPHLCKVHHSLCSDYHHHNPASSLEKHQDPLVLLEAQPRLREVRNILNDIKYI